MKTNLIEQIVDNLRMRGENPEYIISYLKKIISGLQAVAPKPVTEYLNVRLSTSQDLRFCSTQTSHRVFECNYSQHDTSKNQIE